MRLCVVGTGYVGLVAGAGFSDMGNEVVCIDIDASKVERLSRGELTIFEPGLEPLVRSNLAEGRLRFSTDLAAEAPKAEVVILAVGTPQGDDGSADLRALFAAASTLRGRLQDGAVVVTKSTVPVGTGDRLRRFIAEGHDRPFHVASNPEFLKEGTAVQDFLRPERVIIGTDDPVAVEKMRYLYEPFVRTSGRILVMDLRSAELSKYAANAMLATRISFMNEMARLCELVGADVEAVRVGVGSDGRIGAKFLFAGAGYGGSCFPKDLRALEHTAREVGLQLGVVRAVEEVNERQKRWLGEKILARLGPEVRGKRVAVWGLAFKPGTDDVREAPAQVLIEQLHAAGCTISAHDPVAIETFRNMIGERAGIAYAASPYDAADGADALVLVTEWGEYRRPSFDRLLARMRGRALFDGRNVWDPAECARQGFTYSGLGR